MNTEQLNEQNSRLAIIANEYGVQPSEMVKKIIEECKKSNILKQGHGSLMSLIKKDTPLKIVSDILCKVLGTSRLVYTDEILNLIEL